MELSKLCKGVRFGFEFWTGEVGVLFSKFESVYGFSLPLYDLAYLLAKVDRPIKATIETKQNAEVTNITLKAR